jgi:hypothetical protein
LAFHSISIFPKVSKGQSGAYGIYGCDFTFHVASGKIAYLHIAVMETRINDFHISTSQRKIDLFAEA